MTPKQYIAAQQSKSPRRPIRISDLPKDKIQHLEEVMKVTSHSSEKALAKVDSVGDYGEYLLGLIRQGLPRETLRFLEEGLIAVGEIGDQTPNAYTERVGAGCAILFNSGLRDFVYRVARAFSTRAQPNTLAGTEATVSIEETARVVAEIFWWFNETGMPFGPGYTIQPHQILFAHRLATAAEMFLLAHELSHATAMIKADGSSTEPALGTAQVDEFLADGEGIAIVLANITNRIGPSSMSPDWAYAGAEFALQISATFEALGARFVESHPPATERLSFVRNFTSENLPDSTSWDSIYQPAHVIDLVFQALTKTILSPSAEQADFLRRAEEEIAKELIELLNRCSGGAVPDYFTFSSEASAILNRGYSSRILEEVGQIAYTFMHNIETAGVSRGAWIAFQQYKLLLGLAGDMAEPARSVFLSALDARTK